MRVLRLCGQYMIPRRWDNEFLWVIGCKVNPYALSPRRLLGEPPYITYGDNVMQEFTKINLIQLTLFSLLFVMMSGLGSQASRM